MTKDDGLKGAKHLDSNIKLIYALDSNCKRIIIGIGGSATIDGAGEVKIFWKIAMSLSKPIMAVIALGAFNAAYRNFMFAFIVCQDQDMWTMMVHIYQLMQRSCAGVGFAALVIAAIPTFVVFVFFQNIIIKGIVVPTEK